MQSETPKISLANQSNGYCGLLLKPSCPPFAKIDSLNAAAIIYYHLCFDQSVRTVKKNIKIIVWLFLQWSQNISNAMQIYAVSYNFCSFNQLQHIFKTVIR